MHFIRLPDGYFQLIFVIIFSDSKKRVLELDQKLLIPRNVKKFHPVLRRLDFPVKVGLVYKIVAELTQSLMQTSVSQTSLIVHPFSVKTTNFQDYIILHRH